MDGKLGRGRSEMVDSLNVISENGAGSMGSWGKRSGSGKDERESSMIEMVKCRGAGAGFSGGCLQRHALRYSGCVSLGIPGH